jgi:galactokinase
MTRFDAWAPGRVNLIGEHTDYTGGLVLPMAVDLGTRIIGRTAPGRILLRSRDMEGALDIALPVGDPAAIEPQWGRYVGGVAAELGATIGFEGEVSSSVPLGAGLSSSAALEIAVALALRAVDDRLGPPGAVDPVVVATQCQRAEQLASGVPCGIMDQLASAAGVEGHAMRIDCATLEVTPVPIPEGAQIVVVDSGQSRELAGSAYAERRRECELAEERIGPLRHARLELVDELDAPLRRRARHVVTENARVDELAAAFQRGDLATAGRAMTASHASLRDDFDVSTPALDRLVDELLATEGVVGARLTGAGFGGCVVALARAGTRVIPADRRGWIVTPAAGARVRLIV